MKITLAAVDNAQTDAWTKFCFDLEDVSAFKGSILDTHCDAAVSLANSFGFNGGIDASHGAFTRGMEACRKDFPRYPNCCLSRIGDRVGRVSPAVCAHQMRTAFEEFQQGKFHSPESWTEASENSVAVCRSTATTSVVRLKESALVKSYSTFSFAIHR